jgi:hypothetical protein
MRAHVALATVLFASSCATSTDVSPERVHVEKSALALTQADTGVYQLFVSQDALNNGTEFLLSTSAVITDYGDPNFQGNLSRVVFFKRADGKVQLLESQKGAAIEAALVKPNIVTSFDIVSEDGNNVGLDFNKGVASLFYASDWTASDTSSPEYAFLDRFSRVELSQRYVDEAKTDDKGRITVRQVAQADYGGTVSTLELRYFFQPYQPDATYPALVSKQEYRWSGFFESAPSIVPGTTSFQTYVSRFHPAKPLKYAISSNTPAEVREAVRDGILYWNRALGRDWIEVVDAPDGVTAPNLDYNLIQWVTERGAVFAYADAQLDPLTGEVKNAQVFFPSGWYDSTELDIVNGFGRRVEDIAAARKRAADPDHDSDAKAKETAEVTKQAAKPGRALGGCDVVNARKLESAAKLMQKHGVAGPDVKRAALDWVRSAVSHEVGHTLGLRHNFAGSLGSNIEPSEVDGLIQSYFQTFDWPADKVPGSSVMEYPSFEDDLAIGAHIRLGHPALALDVASIKYLYDGGPAPEGTLFCTDSEQGIAPDCAPYDSGKDIVATLHQQIQDDVEEVANEYVLWLRAAKQAEVSDVFAGVAAEYDAQGAYSRRAQFARLVSTSAQLLAVEREVGSAGINREKIHELTLERVGRTVEAVGGYDQFFGLLPENFEDRFYSTLAGLLSSPWITSGTTASGGTWSFTEGELTAIAEYAPKYLELWRAAAADADIAVLSQQDPSYASFASTSSVIIIDDPFGGGGTKWEPPVLSEELQSLLVKRAKYYATSVSGEFSAEVAVVAEPGEQEEEEPGEEEPPRRRWPRPGDDEPTPPEPPETPELPPPGEPGTVIRTLNLPIFTYKPSTRSRASSLLSSYAAEDRLWLRDEEQRKEPARALSALLDEAAGGSFDALVVDDTQDREAIYWILDNQQVLGSFGGAPIDDEGSAEIPEAPEPEPEE